MIEDKNLFTYLLDRPQEEAFLFNTEFYRNKTVLITGAAGSIGSKLSILLAQNKGQSSIHVDVAETPLVSLNGNLQTLNPNATCILCSVLDEQSLSEIFQKYKPQYVIHVAASKHVPLLESNQKEAFKVNVIGTKLLADLSIKNNVERFVYVSTDKAINPLSLMGQTKRVSELYLQSLKAEKTTFTTTRFGNVLGSNGSVLEIFINQIKKNQKITITDKRATRYFMSPLEACKVILHALEKGNSNEVFTYNMGDPISIVKLVEILYERSGKNTSEIQIEYIGLRKGEKINEELFYDSENSELLENNVIKIITQAKDQKGLNQGLEALIKQINKLPFNSNIKPSLKEFIDKHSG